MGRLGVRACLYASFPQAAQQTWWPRGRPNWISPWSKGLRGPGGCEVTCAALLPVWPRRCSIRSK